MAACPLVPLRTVLFIFKIQDSILRDLHSVNGHLSCMHLVFYLCNNMLAWYCSIVVCLSFGKLIRQIESLQEIRCKSKLMCLNTVAHCLSIVSWCCVEMAEWIRLTSGIWLTPHCVIKEFGYIQ